MTALPTERPGAGEDSVGASRVALGGRKLLVLVFQGSFSEYAGTGGDTGFVDVDVWPFARPLVSSVLERPIVDVD